MNIISALLLSVFLILTLLPPLYIIFSLTLWWDSNLHCKWYDKSSFDDWKLHLKIWEPTIRKYNNSILDSIYNIEQAPEHGHFNSYRNPSTNITELTITKYSTCKVETLRDYFHARKCCPIKSFEFTIEISKNHECRYLIQSNNSCELSFIKYEIKNGCSETIFSSSEELFRDYENQKLLALFS